MNSHPLSGGYFLWLASQIRGEEDGSPNSSYEGLLTIMYEKEWTIELVPHDSNRIGDGLDLRVEFCRYQNIPADAMENLGPCSFLEVLIGLSRRLAFTAGGSAPNWAWCLVSNLELHRITDPMGARKYAKAHDILDNCIYRNYSPDGTGGFFPLRWPQEDQRQVEIWYQMATYINEQYPPRR